MSSSTFESIRRDIKKILEGVTLLVEDRLEEKRKYAEKVDITQESLRHHIADKTIHLPKDP